MDAALSDSRRPPSPVSPTGLLILASVLCVALAACGGGGGDDNPPPPDLSGVWAGTWEGTDTIFGRVTGAWEVDASQSASAVTGVARLSGDVDCAEGILSGVSTGGSAPGGTLTRDPCPANEWVLTGLDLATRSASGTWTKPATGGSGSFTGTQIATPGGPRIRFFSPPGGGPGTIVTIVGDDLEGLTPPNLLFDTVPAAQILSADPERTVAVVPAGARKGPVFATTAGGLAISSRHFDPGAGHPSSAALTQIDVGTPQQGLATSPDGRRVFVAAESLSEGPAVFMVDTAARQTITATPVAVASGDRLGGVAVSPDGRRVYVAAGQRGVAVLHGISNVLVETLPLPSGQGPYLGPQGLAVSPDGRRLFVADARDGGDVRVWDLTTRGVVASVPGGEDLVPRAVVVSPDGQLAYLAVASLSGVGEVRVFDNTSLSVVAAIPVGSRPIDLALSPDGKKLYVAHEFDDLMVIETTTRSQRGRVPLGGLPQGVGMTPDGKELLVATGSGQALTVVDTATDQVAMVLPLPGSPFAVALSPDGQRAYVTYSDSDSLTEWTGDRLLTVAKGGTGIGTVTSYPVGLECGFSCQASFAVGTVIQLSAAPFDGSVFSGWGGDPDCSDGRVTLDESTTCTATFTEASGGSPTPPCEDDGCCFLRSLGGR